MLPKEGWSASFVAMSFRWAKIAIVSGIAFVVLVCFYYLAMPFNFIGRTDPVGGEAGYEAVVSRTEAELQKTGATWIATTDYRTYAMLRWFFNNRVPVVQINERGRYQGFRAPDMSLIAGHVGLYVGREPENNPSMALWASGPGQARAAGEGRSRLARDRHGYLRDRKVHRLDAGAVAAAGFAAVRLALAGVAVLNILYFRLGGELPSPRSGVVRLRS